MKKVRILSIDGGGIRGIIPASVLKYVEEQFIKKSKNPNARIADYFDMIVGTSTGGILTCFYLTPNFANEKDKPSARYTAAQALDFYVAKGYDIFNKSKIRNWLGIRSLFNATRYSPKALEKLAMSTFEDGKLSDLLKPCLVTTYNLKSKSAFFFSSRESADKEREFLVRDVVRSTSAAPTYFPSAKIRNLATNEKMINLDGGVFANNPSMCAYAEARDTIFDRLSKTKTPTAKDLLVLSIGTGAGQMKLPNVEKSGSWGLVNWAKSIPEIMMDGSVDTVAYQMKNLFGSLKKEEQLNYKRIDVPLEDRDYAGDMADATKENIDKLLIAGEKTIEAAKIGNDHEHGLDAFIELLMENE